MDSKAQWELVEKARRQLASDDFFPGLEDSWQSLPIAKKWPRDKTRFSDYVLPSVASWLENIDDYPPPELLIAVAELFQEYMNGAGSLTLEEVFFGKPRQAKGTYAAREAKSDVLTGVGFELFFLDGKRRGLSDTKAAEAAQTILETIRPNVPDAETLLKRRRRRIINSRTKKP